jgi:hypothetical protein
MFSTQQSNQVKANKRDTPQAFFQPKVSVNFTDDVCRKEADGGVVGMPQDNYFFKPNRPPGNIIQRAPITNSNPTPGQPALNQTQSHSVSKRRIPHGAITRKEFEGYLSANFGITDVHTGTKQEQEKSITGSNPVLQTIPNWAEWSPGNSSADYSTIIKAIEDVAKAFSAIPTIRIIRFFERDYKTNEVTGVAIPADDTGALFGAGELDIYKSYSVGGSFPIGKSNAAGVYPNAPVSPVPSGSVPDGAPIPRQNAEASGKQNIAHELGHGIAEAADAAIPDVLINFTKTIGWVRTATPDLYDIGQADVQKAIAANLVPDAKYKIKESNWNSPQWIEQPMSKYAVSGGPGEDFAESIAAFTYAKDSLKARSPRRFKFITDGMAIWTSKMKKIPAISR